MLIIADVVGGSSTGWDGQSAALFSQYPFECNIVGC